VTDEQIQNLERTAQMLLEQFLVDFGKACDEVGASKIERTKYTLWACIGFSAQLVTKIQFPVEEAVKTFVDLLNRLAPQAGGKQHDVVLVPKGK